MPRRWLPRHVERRLKLHSARLSGARGVRARNLAATLGFGLRRGAVRRAGFPARAPSPAAAASSTASLTLGAGAVGAAVRRWQVERFQRVIALFAEERAQAHIALRVWNLDARAAQRIIDRPRISRVHRFRPLHRFQRRPHDQFELQRAIAVADEPNLRAVLSVSGSVNGTSRAAASTHSRTFSLSAPIAT
jgi:hypothetical protein